MKPITESFVNQRLKRAAEALTPHEAGAIWAQPVEKANGGEWYLDGTGPKKRRTGRTIGIFSSLAACLAVCFLSLYMVSFRVDATVYLDVNPSVTLQVNCNEKIIRAQANNPDGDTVLADMDLKNADLNAAVNAVIGSMVRHGYLTEAQDMVLLSVSSGSPGKTESLRARLSGEINDCLTSLVGSGTVFDQEVELDDDLVALAEKYGITPGKAALIRRVVDAHPGIDYDTLARMSITELTGYLTASGVDIRDYANHTGTPFDRFDRDDDVDPDDIPENTGKPDAPDHDDADSPDVPDHDDADSPDVPDYDDADTPDIPDHDDADSPDVPDHDDADTPDIPDYDDADSPDNLDYYNLPNGSYNNADDPDDAADDRLEDNEAEFGPEEADELEDDD